nr:MAG TPA: hypothetical protein [Caudoviricetes sp.]
MRMHNKMEIEGVRTARYRYGRRKPARMPQKASVRSIM